MVSCIDCPHSKLYPYMVVIILDVIHIIDDPHSDLCICINLCSQNNIMSPVMFLLKSVNFYSCDTCNLGWLYTL